MFIRVIFLFISISMLCCPAFGQVATGGPYELEKAAIAGGGGTSDGGQFSLAGTLGQSVVGRSSGGGSVLQGGFWAADFAPTAALVSISGRVTTADGAGIRNARLLLTNSMGRTVPALSGSFGYFRFDSIESGETYFLTVTSKRYTFSEPTRIITVSDEITGIDFVALP